MKRKVTVIVLCIVFLIGTFYVFASDALIDQDKKMDVSDITGTAEPEARSEIVIETSPEPVSEAAEPTSTADDEAENNMGEESESADTKIEKTDSPGNDEPFSEKFYLLADYLKLNIGDNEIIGDILSDYIYYQDVYMLSNEELDYIADLIIIGNDPKDIISITNFWLGTNEDVSIIGQIYGLKDKFEGSKFWIENAFNKVTEYKCGELNGESIDKYLSEGLTASDINTANVLSRKGVYTIQEILDKKLEGTSFVSIANEVSDERLFGQTQTMAIDSGNSNELFSDDMIEDSIIINCKEFAVLSETTPAEILVRAANGENIQEDIKEKKNEKYADIYKSLRNIGILSEMDGDLNE